MTRCNDMMIRYAMLRSDMIYDTSRGTTRYDSTRRYIERTYDGAIYGDNTARR